MKKLLSLIISALISVSTCACGTSPEYYDNDYFVMDAVLTVRLSTDGVSRTKLTEISAQTNRIAADIEKILSRTDEDSEVSRFNRDGRIASPGTALTEVLTVSQRINDSASGAFDPTVGALTDLWNIKNGGPVPSAEKIAEALTHTGIDKLTFTADTVSKTDPDLTLDLGGIGKGYAIDKAVGYLASTEVKYGLCSFGSTVKVFGAKPDGERFLVTVRDPADADKTAASFRIAEGAISTSGDYERYFDENGIRYHHILDPETGYPVSNGVHSVTVYAASAAEADALSTALFVLGPEKTAELYHSGDLTFEAMTVTDGGIYLTDGLKNGDIVKIDENEYKIID